MLLGFATGAPMVAGLLAAWAWSGSLTALADGLRAGLLMLLDMFVFLVLRRIHRHRLPGYHYGVGKLEHFLNLMVGATLVLAGAVVLGLATMRATAADSGSAASFGTAAAMSAVNTLQNLVTLAVIWRAGRDGTSVLINGQIRARIGKLASSMIATTSILASVLFAGTLAGRTADLFGSVVIVAVMLWTASRLIRAAMPDLLDAMLDEAQQAAINQVLIRRFRDYDLLHHVRTRQSGRTVFVEIGLGYDAGRTLGEVDRVNRSVAADLRALIPDAEVSIVTSAVTPEAETAISPAAGSAASGGSDRPAADGAHPGSSGATA